MAKAEAKVYVGIDQFGEVFRLGRTTSPRKALMAALGRKSARRIFVDPREGGPPAHVGWIVAGRWVSVYERMEGSPP